ncbi:MAG: hypothetical protein LBK82_08695 [Planctomycetaceae bacterium]|nr:hypothetical protein [Planctomycetaceae bacterium]
MLPFQGGVLLVLTRRVAAGWLVLPLKGRRKNLLSYRTTKFCLIGLRTVYFNR